MLDSGRNHYSVAHILLIKIKLNREKRGILLKAVNICCVKFKKKKNSQI